MQKEYLSWLKDNALVQILDKYNLEKRINELKEPLNLDKKEFANLQKKLLGNPVQAIAYFEELEYIRPFYTTKTLGNLSFRYGEFDEVVKNRRKMLQILNESNAVQNKITTHDFVFASLKSQDKIAIWPQVLEKAGMSLKDYNFETITTQELEKIGLGVDAIILPDLGSVKAGGFVVGDCYVLMIIAPKQNVGALVHIGTPGLSLDLLGKVVNKLQKDFNVLPQDLYVMMGPGILKDYYIYEDISRYKDNPFVKDFLIPVKTSGRGLKAGTTPKVDTEDVNSVSSQEVAQKYHVDLFGGIRNRLLELGVPFEKYRITPQDTYASKFLFSHVRSLRKGEPEGRFMVGFVKLN